MNNERFTHQVDGTLQRAASALALAHEIHAPLRSLTQHAAPACLWRPTPASRFNGNTT